MSWISLIVKDLALGVGPHVMWWLLEGIEPSFDACLSPGGRFTRAAEERNGRKNDLLEPPFLDQFAPNFVSTGHPTPLPAQTLIKVHTKKYTVN